MLGYICLHDGELLKVYRWKSAVWDLGLEDAEGGNVGGVVVAGLRDDYWQLDSSLFRGFGRGFLAG